MKLKKTLLTIFPLVALVLEILPYGAVLNFANPEGEPWRKVYSYFDLTLYGYANFGPFITAILTGALLVLAVIYLFHARKGLITAVKSVSGIATAASLMPLMYGFDYITVIGIAITVMLAGTFGCCFIKER